jgi:response regulator RpfG family c-di-GMP phosphodiesterase
MKAQEILVRQSVKVLIVDDSTYNLFVMKELLSQIDPSMEIE